MHEVGRVLYGSNNYNLDGPDSDKDYKVFLCPDFNDLYNNKRVEKNDLPAATYGEQFSPMDVRQFARGLQKGNVNCCEYLFSTEKVLSSNFSSFVTTARKLYEDGYLMVVWPTFFASLEGMAKNALGRYGMTRKAASRAYYLYLLVCHLMGDDFRMNERSWRGNAWNFTSRAMRFNENAWMPSFEQLMQTLDRVKESSRELAKKRYGHNPERVAELQKRGAALEDAMMYFVKHELKCKGV